MAVLNSVILLCKYSIRLIILYNRSVAVVASSYCGPHKLIVNSLFPSIAERSIIRTPWSHKTRQNHIDVITCIMFTCYSFVQQLVLATAIHPGSMIFVLS